MKAFVLMPFDRKYDPVYAIIKRTARSAGYTCYRADDKCVSGNVVRQIIDEISEADVVIADLTGRNPNVFYETAIAHERKKENKVILIAQKDKDVPFDLQALRYLKYSIREESGKKRFRDKLRNFLKEAGKDSSSSPFEVIEGTDERTRRITAELNTLAANNTLQFHNMTIYAQTALSIFSVSKKEVDSAITSQQKHHKELISSEKKATIDLIRMGAICRVILNPPIEGAEGFNLTYLEYRYQEMIKLLDPKTTKFEDVFSTKSDIEFAISPIRQNNMLIIGDNVCFEGRKSGFLSGYDVTTRITDKILLSSLNNAFTKLFDDAKKHTVSKYRRNRKGKTNKDMLRESVYDGINECYRKYLARKR